jgi:hypothetical protein
MKRSNRKRHRPEDVVAKLTHADEAIERVANRWGSPIAEPALAVVRSLVEAYAETGAVSVI